MRKTNWFQPLVSFAFLLTVSLASTIAVPQAHAQCACFAQLKYRGVNVGNVPTGYNHAFWWFKTASPAPNGMVYVAEGDRLAVAH
jgi:hypothetical protein